MSNGVHERTLLVEGDDDKKFFTTLLEKELGFEKDSFVIEPPKATGEVFRNGINTLLKILPSRLNFVKGGTIKQLGIIIDADSGEFGFHARRKQITDILDTHGYIITDAPDQPSLGESFSHPDGFTVWLWIMPNHANDGLFENFLLETIRTSPQTGLLETAQTAVGNLGEQQLFIEKHTPKAQLSTWLAWQKDVGMSVGYAYYSGLFDKTHPNVTNLITWLRKVFPSQ
jgi:hypothetical protein